MDATKIIYENLKKACQGLKAENIDSGESENFFKEAEKIFQKPFNQNSISFSSLPRRLLNLEKLLEVNSPLLLLPERKQLLTELISNFMRLDEKTNFVVTGNAAIGKSHSALMLALLLRTMNERFVTVYIPNTAEFGINTIPYVSKELFLWFYDMISSSPWLKILVNLLLKDDQNDLLLKFVLQECLKEAKKQNKTTVFIQDQVNLMRENIPPPFSSFKAFIDFFCLFTTSTDFKLRSIKREDAEIGAVEYSLNPKAKMEDEQCKAFINNKFVLDDQKDAALTKLLLDQTAGDFSILQEFHRYFKLI